MLQSEFAEVAAMLKNIAGDLTKNISMTVRVYCVFQTNPCVYKAPRPLLPGSWFGVQVSVS